MSYVNLSGTHLGDDDLTELEGLPDVDVLDLSGARVTDAGLRHLKRLTRLQVLVLDGTQVTEAGVDDLRGPALPGLAIVVSHYSMHANCERAASRVFGLSVLNAGLTSDGLRAEELLP